MPTTKGGAQGVGGGSEFVLTAEMPTAIQGYCGTLTVKVVSEPIPLLLPITFSKALGMVLDMPEQTIFWKNLDCKQSFEELTSGHLAIDVFEFPPSGWKCPHSHATRSGTVSLGNPLDPSISQSEYEIALAYPKKSTDPPKSPPTNKVAPVAVRPKKILEPPLSQRQTP